MYLKLTPWSRTNNFVECHLQGQGNLEIGGDGDPSGIGEGFAMVRAQSLRGKAGREEDDEGYPNKK